MFKLKLLFTSLFLCLPLSAQADNFSFELIEGETFNTASHKGPILVVNTASRCGFTRQYAELQSLWDRYKGRGLLVLAIPSNDFKQELANNADVKEFCEVNYNLTLPLTEITHVAKGDIHPFFKWVAAETRFTPNWNFNKILIGSDRTILGTFRSMVKPEAGKITSLIEADLKG